MRAYQAGRVQYSLAAPFAILLWLSGCDQAELKAGFEPPPDSLQAISLRPASITLAPGGTSQFAATGTWSDGSTTTPAVAYSATGGTITVAGLYTAGSAPGTFGVIATQQGGTRADTSAVTVSVPTSTLTQLVLTPASITLAPGGTSQFTVSGTWSDGSSTTPAVSYSATGGTITAGGLYTAGTAPGTFRVIATQQGGTRADTAAVTVSVPPPTLTQLVLNPASLTLSPGATQQFSVTASWSDGSSTVPAVSYSATGGTITTGGLYTAGTTPGSFRVIVTQQGGTRADTSAVTVSVPTSTLTQLVLSPGSITLAPGGTSQFAVTGTWSDGSTTTPAVAYSATGGTITAAGLYTAGTAPGTFGVIATQQGGTKADTSAVTVMSGRLVVDAGADQTIPLGTLAVLNATVTSTSPGPLRMFWRKISGPGVVAFAHEQFNSSFEDGTTSEWDGDGGGQSIGGASVSQDVAHSGSHSWMGYNDPTLPDPFNYSAKLLRWRFNDDEAYYSAWFYWPSGYGVTDIGNNYVNIFQWKEGGAPFDPPWIVIAKNFSGFDEFGIHDYFGANLIRTGIAIPKNTWFNITAYMKASTTAGQLVVWIDGQLAYNQSGLNTLGSASTLMWGVGNYGTPGIGPGKQLYVDDATVVQAGKDVTKTTATFSAAGTYVLRLTAFDGTSTMSDDVIITAR